MCDVPLDETSCKQPRLMNEEYLRKGHYLSFKDLNGEPVYQFPHSEVGEGALIVLPNPEFTTLDSIANYRFNPPLHMLTQQESLRERRQSKRAASRPSSSNQGIVAVNSPPPAAPQEPGISPQRQAHSPQDSDEYVEEPGTYEEHVPLKASAHVQHAHHRTNLLQKPVKWVVKKFKKLVKSLKDEKAEREERWKAEREAMETHWNAQVEALRKEHEEQRAAFATMSARFVGESSRGVQPGRHSLFENPTQGGSPMDTSPVAPTQRRHSISAEPTRPTRDASPDVADNTNDRPLLELSRWHQNEPTPVPFDHDIVMVESRPNRRANRRYRQRRPASSNETRINEPSQQHHEPTYSREYIEAQTSRFFNYDD